MRTRNSMNDHGRSRKCICDCVRVSLSYIRRFNFKKYGSICIVLLSVKYSCSRQRKALLPDFYRVVLPRKNHFYHFLAGSKSVPRAKWP